MSFRELRNFCEAMRSLGYTRIISMENFRTPNFQLVADCLDWLLHRFEPSAAIPDDISTEADRIAFIKAVCERFHMKTGVKLNARKLYGADGYAVKELLKLANMLYDAQKSVGDMPADTSDENFALSSKLSDLKSTRSLCSQIVESGASLFDLLHKETEVCQDREKALRFLDGLSRNLDSNSEHDMVEQAVISQLSSHGQSLEQLKTMADELQRDEKSLEQKIRKKRQELERCKKRLGSLVNVRPAFMDEYEKLEQELERYYEQYVGRFRNLDYLEYELDMLNREEKERMEENDRALKNLQKRLREKEWRLLRGEDEEGEGRKNRGGAAEMQGWRPAGQKGSGTDVYGAMDAGDDDDASGSDSDPPISFAGSNESGDDDPAVHIGGSDEDDILNESEDEEDISDDEPAVRRPQGRSGHDNHDF
eukprot:TRINITY_DN927_c0_g1_i1.p1 TRINITY_DN927_c0_g1~~TRINITY_DN927_c0_g1_i1.p1  ORF type:complete len:423 (+),score=116.39 TRINITY_DN927_c0_g1_i1:133-1401(+)